MENIGGGGVVEKGEEGDAAADGGDGEGYSGEGYSGEGDDGERDAEVGVAEVDDADARVDVVDAEVVEESEKVKVE